MNSSNIAVHFGRRMSGVATRRVQNCVATVLVTPLLALPVGAGEYYPAPECFAGRLSADSSWTRF